jgi:hypothetical protein
MRLMRRAFVKRLLKRQLQQLFAGRLTLVNVINPEFAAFSGMFSDGAAILAGDSDFHIDSSLASSRETFNAIRRSQVG